MAPGSIGHGMGARSSSWTARLAAVVLVAGYALLTVLACATESPLRPPLPAGVDVPRWGARTARALGFDGLSRGVLTALSLIVVAVAIGAFVLLVREAWHHRASWLLLGTATAASLALAVAAPMLLSRDVYSYASYGRMVARYGANPYRTSPAAFPGDVFTPVISRAWVRTRSVYGPLFTLVSAGLARAWFGSPGATMTAFKMLAGLSAAGAATFGAAATRRLAAGRERAALVLVGANPVVFLHTVGGGHNDAVVAFGVAAALWLVARRRQALRPGAVAAVTILLTLAALVKVVALIPLALWVWEVWRDGRRMALVQVTAAAALTAGFTAPFFAGWRTISALANLASRQGWASPARLVARGAEAAVRSWAGAGMANALGAVVYAASLGVAAVLVWRRAKRTLEDNAGSFAARTWGPGLLLFALAAPYLLPWYAVWFLPLVAASGEEAVLWIAVATSAVLAMTGIPDEPAASPALWRGMLLAVHYVAAPLMVVVFVIAVRHERRRVSEPS